MAPPGAGRGVWKILKLNLGEQRSQRSEADADLQHGEHGARRVSRRVSAAGGGRHHGHCQQVSAPPCPGEGQRSDATRSAGGRNLISPQAKTAGGAGRAAGCSRAALIVNAGQLNPAALPLLRRMINNNDDYLVNFHNKAGGLSLAGRGS